MSSKIQAPQEAVLAPGSLILITGITSYIGAHVANELLKRGYRVRGVIRSPNNWLNKHFSQVYGDGCFETYQVKDVANEEELVPAMKGVQGVIHTASDVTFNPDPTVVIPIAVNLATSALRATARNSDIKRFVLTSSSSAVAMYGSGQVRTLTSKDFADGYVEQSKEPGPYGPERMISTYAASKTLSEKAVWEWVASNEGKTDLIVNSILPDFNFGLPLSVENQGFPSSAGIGKALFDGDMTMPRMLPPQYFIDVKDSALLHVAALLHPEVKGERIFGFAEKKSNNKCLDIFRELFPERKFAENDPNEGVTTYTIAKQPHAEELLRWISGRGWISMRDSLKEMGEGCIKYEETA